MYRDEIYVKDESIGGIHHWLWPKADIGLWVGPKHDWENGYAQKVFDLTPQRRTVVQAGGGCGMYPRLLSDHFDFVYTFEPSPLNFFCLVNNCQKNNIIKINAALGDKHEMIHMIIRDPHNLGMNVVGRSGAIPQFRIDDLMLNDCDAILLDVEGDEELVIKGALETIKKFKPVIVVETSTEPMFEILTKFGYHPVDTYNRDVYYKVV